MSPIHPSSDNVSLPPADSAEPSASSADDFDLAEPEVMVQQSGRLPGNVQMRITHPQEQPFHRIKQGVLEATEAVEIPESTPARLLYWGKRALIGVPLASAHAESERLSKFKALAILSSDAISSVAFATEAILINLAAGGSAHLGLVLPISLTIIGLLAIVALSYRQTIPAYPNGGGSYIVARQNLGLLPGLVAAAALMIDYVLNVAVCVSAGILNIVAIFPGLEPYIVPLDLALVVAMTILNLRGMRESGTIFAFPTYFFIASSALLILVGLLKAYVFLHQPLIAQFHPVTQAIEPLSIFLILRAFATGCTAMTGVEAISNAIPVFHRPETRNAAITLTWMACILGALFLGTTLLALTYGIEANPGGSPTVIAQIGRNVFSGPLAFFVPLFQLSVLGILTLSAETSYAGFPRLASLLAKDRFLPAQFSFRGDRLAFSLGIGALAVLAGLLLVIFRGQTNALINLFAVGVFVAFTLSQAGMVVHWWRLRAQQRNWRRSMLINGTGACATAVVTLVVASMKFLDGAWMVIVLIPVLVLLFLGIRRHYLHVDRERIVDLPVHPADIHHRLIVPLDRLDRATIRCLAYARSISPHVTAVHVMNDEERVEQMRSAWKKWQEEIGDEEETHLLIIESPYRSLLRPLLAYIDVIHERHPQDTITVILAEFVLAHWWEYFLHNHTALRLKAGLLFRPGVAVLNIPQHLGDREQRPARLH
ncbi:MAG TPA: APC family permease [Ktedonobacteraceae bacterium]